MPRDRTGPATTSRAVRGIGGLLAALVVGSLSLGACSVVKDVSKIAHAVSGNKRTIDLFTSKVQSGEAVPFEATYVTTGSAPATIVYAVRPPAGLSFSDTPSRTDGPGTDAVGFDVVVNPSGEFACTPPASSASRWTCQKLDPASATTENKIFNFYTPSHWIQFLKEFSLAAGFAGDKISSSTLSLNGFNMSCVDFVASGVPGTSTICTTSQGILGYVKVASSSTSFEITKFSSSPPASAFDLPPGAKITAPSRAQTP
jgi:hypothetical protein